MPATPQRCAAVVLISRSLIVCTALLLLVGCSGKSTGQIAPPTATPGDISVAVDRASYTHSQPVGVTVANKSKTNYYAKNGLSACTYLQLEFYDTTKKAWLGVDGCTVVTAPHMLLLAPSSSLPYTLAPGDSSNDPNSWVPGVYRISLRYTTSSDGSGAVTVAYSAGFNVTG